MRLGSMPLVALTPSSAASSLKLWRAATRMTFFADATPRMVLMFRGLMRRNSEDITHIPVTSWRRPPPIPTGPVVVAVVGAARRRAGGEGLASCAGPFVADAQPGSDGTAVAVVKLVDSELDGVAVAVNARRAAALRTQTTAAKFGHQFRTVASAGNAVDFLTLARTNHQGVNYAQVAKILSARKKGS